jgi:hypothetical protein
MPKMPKRKALAIAAIVLALVLAPSAAGAVCGDFSGDGSVNATDALGILKVVVGFNTCRIYECDVDDNGNVTATDALTVLKRAVGQQILLVCPIDPDCVSDLDFFFESIWTPILTDCVACHNETGLASFTDHVLWPSTTSGYLEHNFGVLQNLDSIGKGELLLTKPQGISHGGGQRLGITTESPLYANLTQLLDRFAHPVPDCGGAPADFYAGVASLSDVEVLRKAALLFAGRLPTPAEVTVASRNRDATLRQTIRGLMSGPNFEQFLIESSNDRLLTDQFLLGNPSAFDVLRSDWDYPHLLERINAIQASEGDEAAWEATLKTNEALTREPLELIVHVATSELPYTEILTADYMMVNPWSSVPYQSGLSFTDNDSTEEWLPGTNQGYRLPGYPHSGILSSPILLGRYPSTATNRNRARARWAYYFFLGVDIEKLAPRPIDPEALADPDNPTMNNPHCAVCHSVHDPVAGTYQNFGDGGHYRENETDALPWSYKESDLYQDGDLWYRDMRPPGFNNVVMPASENDTSLAWLARQFIADPRFTTGTVKFWWPAVFGEKPIDPPTEPTDADFRTRLEAWAAQDETIRTVAQAFGDGTAGTAEHGAYNLKDLLVEMLLTPAYRARSVTGLDAERADALAEVGHVRLLTPEQLNRKLLAVVGYNWAPRWAPDWPGLLREYRLLYGGTDSAGVTVRATELNAIMSTVTQRMANEAACPIAVTDFSRPAAERLLFPYVEPSTTPDTPAGSAAILANIVYLHDRLIGESSTTDDPEVLRTYQLFQEIRQLRVTSAKSTYLPWAPAYCDLDFESGAYIDRDHDHTVRAWISVLIYLMGDYRFLYE